MSTEPLYRDDAYRQSCEAVVRAVTAQGGIVLDRTVFYAAGGGQPGDSGRLSAAGAAPIAIANAVPGETAGDIVHVAAALGAPPEPGTPVTAEIDWPRRERHMRMHTALHLLCALLPYPVTGGAVGAEESRLDFDIADAHSVEREALTEALNALVAADHPVTARWISDAELADNPGLVRTMRVKPPTGSGRVRLIAIGADGVIDLQPCGGTHVRSTGEIGRLAVAKIEKKGRLNRRIRLRFAETE